MNLFFFFYFTGSSFRFRFIFNFRNYLTQDVHRNCRKCEIMKLKLNITTSSLNFLRLISFYSLSHPAKNSYITQVNKCVRKWVIIVALVVFNVLKAGNFICLFQIESDGIVIASKVSIRLVLKYWGLMVSRFQVNCMKELVLRFATPWKEMMWNGSQFENNQLSVLCFSLEVQFEITKESA